MFCSDRVFERLFASLFVYTLLYEDSEVDERFLGVDERSRVLAISGAGCRVAMHMAARPERLDVVDINAHHLALSSLKIEAMRRLRSNELLFDTVAGPGVKRPERDLAETFAAMPKAQQRYWKRYSGRLRASLLHQGLTGRMVSILRRIAHVDESFLRSLLPLGISERERRVMAVFRPVLRHPIVRSWLESPFHLVALGVNFTQRDRMLHADEPSLAAFILGHLRRVAATDLARNWFAWFALAGRLPAEEPEALPPYLRKDRHLAAIDAPTEVRYHNTRIQDVVAEAHSPTWTHVTLCDALDWFPANAQVNLLLKLHRVLRPGGMVALRSVESDCLIERLGLDHKYQRMVAESAEATRLDRTRQYRSVSYYRAVQ